GEGIVHGICEAIDGEKDPRCLMHTFQLVETLARLFPDPSGPLASYARELFEVLGCYFPIYFTHVSQVNDGRLGPTQAESGLTQGRDRLGPTQPPDPTLPSLHKRVELYIAGCEKPDHLIGDEKKSDIQDPKYVVWLRDDSVLMSRILNSVSAGIRPTILHKSTAADMWKIFSSLYGRKIRSVYISYIIISMN
ncbi:hypothetical protein Taro_008185, partial [Colocasia esculenta]|nr:hypothetical protein [Colocasia esculenta]